MQKHIILANFSRYWYVCMTKFSNDIVPEEEKIINLNTYAMCDSGILQSQSFNYETMAMTKAESTGNALIMERI